MVLKMHLALDTWIEVPNGDDMWRLSFIAGCEMHGVHTTSAKISKAATARELSVIRLLRLTFD